MDKLKNKPKRSSITLRAREIFKEIFKNIGIDIIDEFGNPYHADHDYTAKLNLFRDDFEQEYGYSMTILEEGEQSSHIVFGINRKCSNVWSALMRFKIYRKELAYGYSFENLNLKFSGKNDLKNIEVVGVVLSEIRKFFEK